MIRYLVRRVLGAIPLLLGISFLVFILVNAAPGNPFDALILNPGTRPQDIQALNKAYGLDKPLPVRYFVWLGHVAQGDFGRSLINYQPERESVMARLPNTLKLTLAAFLLALIFSIPVGVYCAVRRNSIFDHIATVASVAGVSLPTFWFGLLLILLFAVQLGWLPTGGVAPARGEATILAQLKHLIMPAFVLAISEIAGWTRYIRGQMLEVIRQDYIRTARAKGLKERAVIFQHALRNALLPLVTLFGLVIPNFFSGALITETIFAWPGIGLLTFEAAVARDYPVIMGTVMFSAVLVILGNLLSDIGYSLLDPRIKQG
jgi:peptide/nickel transport system permease protein